MYVNPMKILVRIGMLVSKENVYLARHASARIGACWNAICIYALMYVVTLTNPTVVPM